jgi:5-formyltetrahydrofolate cyclo-ligase
MIWGFSMLLGNLSIILHSSSTVHRPIVAASLAITNSKLTPLQKSYHILHHCRPFDQPARCFVHHSILNMSGKTDSSSSDDQHAAAGERIRQQKQELRQRIRKAVKELSDQEVQEQSARVWQRVLALPVYQSARHIGVFLSMPHGEIQTDILIQDCVLQGKTVYVPEVGQNFEHCDMELRKVILKDDKDPLFHKKWPNNKWNIPEPPSDMPIEVAKPGDLDLVIMPGLAFDRERHRLGQGKGYYDRFLARMMVGDKKLPLVAVALSPQLVEDTSIPVAEYDQSMDMVVLPHEVIGSVEE